MKGFVRHSKRSIAVCIGTTSDNITLNFESVTSFGDLISDNCSRELYILDLLVRAMGETDLTDFHELTVDFIIGSAKVEGKISISGDSVNFAINGKKYAIDYHDLYPDILEPLGYRPVPLARHIQEIQFKVGEKEIFLLEDIDGYYNGGDSDIWLFIPSDQLLIAMEGRTGEEFTVMEVYKPGYKSDYPYSSLEGIEEILAAASAAY